MSTGIDLVTGSGTSASIMWKLPTVLGVSLTGTYAPDMGSVDTADKTAGVSTDNDGRGYDVTVNINPTLGTRFCLALIYLPVHIATSNIIQGKIMIISKLAQVLRMQ